MKNYLILIGFLVASNGLFSQPLFNVLPSLSCGQSPNIQLYIPNQYTSYFWDMGNGITGNTYQPPAVTYTNTGQVNISLTVTNSTPFRIIDSVIVTQTNSSWNDCLGADDAIPDFYIVIRNSTGTVWLDSPVNLNQSTPSTFGINNFLTAASMSLTVMEADNTVPFCLFDENMGAFNIPANTTGGVFQNSPEGLIVKVITKLVTSVTYTRTINISEGSVLITEVCGSNSHVLSAPANMQDYIWSTGHTTQSITVNTPGAYSVTVTTMSGCKSRGTISVTNTTPTPPDIMCAGNILVCTNYTNFIRWLDSNKIPIAGATNITFTPTTPGIYYALYDNGQACATMSIGISYPDCTSDVHTLDELTQFTIHPNPNNGIFHVSLSFNRYTEATLGIYDMLGQQVASYSIQGTAWKKSLDLAHLSSGAYQLVVQTSQERQATRRFVLTH